MPTFIMSTVIDAPVETVFGFHERGDALALLSQPFPPVRIVSRSGGIETGARVELRVGWLRWIALHTACERNRLFVDEQIQGPFSHWVHRHQFDDLQGRTRLTDRVEYQLPGGALIQAMFGWVVKAGLHRMFVYRHRVTRRMCEKP